MTKVLLVDDDPNVLSAYSRRLRKRFEIETALCSEEGVTAVNFLGPFSVIVSDMQMPRENGAEFLAKIQKTSPDSVRIMLTGNADQQTAIDAVNQGGVFCFLNKPCQAEELESAIQRGINEYRRIKELRDYAKVNVNAMIETLASACEALNPETGARQARLKSCMSEYAKLARIDNLDLYLTVAIVSQLGAHEVPSYLFSKVAQLEDLSQQERSLWQKQFQVAQQVIEHVPHLSTSVQVLRLLGGEQPIEENEFSEEVQLASELLKASIQFDLSCQEGGLETIEVLEHIQASQDYREIASKHIEKWVAARDQRRLVEVSVDALVDGMKLVEEISTTSGVVLVPKGIEVCPSMRAKLRKYVDSNQIKDDVKALVPIDQLEEELVELLSC